MPGESRMKLITGIDDDEHSVSARDALARYGATIASNGFIRRGEKLLGVRMLIHKERLRVMSGDVLLATYSKSNIERGVSDFVEKFWFWERVQK